MIHTHVEKVKVKGRSVQKLYTWKQTDRRTEPITLRPELTQSVGKVGIPRRRHVHGHRHPSRHPHENRRENVGLSFSLQQA